MSKFFTLRRFVFWKSIACLSFPVNKLTFCRVTNSFPPNVTVFCKSTVSIDCVLFSRNKSVLVRFSRSSWSNSEETSFWVDSIKTTVFSELHPCNIITYSFNLPSRDSRNQHSEVCFTAGTWESTCNVFNFTLRVSQFQDKHVLCKPSLFTSDNSSNTKSKTFLTKKSVSTVSRTVRPDEVLFRELRDVFVFNVSTRPYTIVFFAVVKRLTN